MFSPTNNLYKFNYLITGITGEGIPGVYLPDHPEHIHFKAENKFVRPEMPKQIKRWAKEWADETKKNKKYIHPHEAEINAWIDQEWERSENGFWFWNNGVPTYITGFYYWYLTAWVTYFGLPFYRETDKELTYLIKYIEEDPDAFGLLLNTIRRYGKSSLLAALIAYRTMRNYQHTTGMQGETEKKIKKFYNKMLLKPLQKLPFYYLPEMDRSGTNKNEIRFDKTPTRGKNHTIDEDDEPLESMIDFRATNAAEYDGDVLNSYLIEEPGKIMEASIYSDEGDGIWDVVKPCFLKGGKIRGKAFMGTTVEFLNVADRGGKAYKALFYDSDFNDKKKNGRTKSGLYAAFLPGDCAHEDFLDEYGHPNREKAKEYILEERDSFKNNPSKLSGLIRKYPLDIVEIFYLTTDDCEFNAEVIQTRLREIETNRTPMVDKVDLFWENNIRFSRVLWRKNNENGWLSVNYLPDIKDANKVEKVFSAGNMIYRPKNDDSFAIGFDPIQHQTNGRGSRPVALVKRKYDSAIDGVIDEDIMMERAKARYPYQTNKYIAMMDKRPTDPNILFERLLMICWYFGCSAHIEKQKDAVISYFHEKNCGDFVLAKYTHVYDGAQKLTDGTASTPKLIEEYTSAYAHYIEYFGHTIPFKEQLKDALLFNPSETTVHDYTVAAGFCELACKMKPKVKTAPIRDISDFLPIFDQAGNVIA